MTGRVATLLISYSFPLRTPVIIDFLPKMALSHSLVSELILFEWKQAHNFCISTAFNGEQQTIKRIANPLTKD